MWLEVEDEILENIYYQLTYKYNWPNFLIFNQIRKKMAFIFRHSENVTVKNSKEYENRIFYLLYGRKNYIHNYDNTDNNSEFDSEIDSDEYYST